jgi:hypothetical protein
MQKTTLLGAILLMVPSVLADEFTTLYVTSGYIQIYGDSPGDTFFSGDGFTAVGGLTLLDCPLSVSPIIGCSSGGYTGGLLELTMDGVTQNVDFPFDYAFFGTQEPIFVPPGLSEATFSEPATIGPFQGCAFGAACDIPPPQNPHYSFVITGDVTFSVTVVTDGSGSYTIQDEAYTITTPEPSGPLSLLPLAFGLIGLALNQRRRNFQNALRATSRTALMERRLW